MAAAARNSTRAYMDSLAGGYTYDDLFAAAFRPEHREVLRELTTMATREAVATYLRPPPPFQARPELPTPVPTHCALPGFGHHAAWNATLKAQDVTSVVVTLMLSIEVALLASRFC